MPKFSRKSINQSINRVALSSCAILLLTQGLHAYSPSTALATQGTNTSLTLTGLQGSDTSASLTAIQGTDFATATDTLHAIAVSGTRPCEQIFI